MKINKLYIGLLIAASTLFVACDEYEDTEVKSPTVSASNPGVYFVSSNPTQFEIDPAGLSFTLEVVRKSGTGAIDVPVVEVSDTGDVYTVPSTVSFPAGVDTVNLTVTMSASAVKGTMYGLTLKFNDDYANPYLTEYGTFYGEAAVSIWQNIGTAQFYDAFSFYKVAEVTLWQSTENSSQYRISSPYSEGILLDAEWEGWIGGKTQDKIIFTVSGSNVTWTNFWYTDLLYQGNDGQEVKAYLPSAIGKTGDEQSIVATDTDGNILYFRLKPYFYVDGVGGWGLKSVYLGFPGFDLAGALGLPIYGQK